MGVVLDDALSWNCHLNSIFTNACKRIGMLGRIHEDITLNAANVIYKSFILPIFDYCDSAWAFCNKCDVVMLERLQRRAARIVFKVNSSDVALNSLRWSTLEHRRALHVYLLVNKCLKKCVPQFLIDYFTSNRDRCLRRTRQSHLLHVPKVKLETAKRSFYYNGCIIFNSFTCDSNTS